jgi:uncharacterized protein
MKTFLLSALIALSIVATAQEHPKVTAQPNTVYVGADGKFDANPDTALIHFAISSQENSARAAYEQTAKSTEQVRTIMRNNGIDPKEAQIGYYSLQPVYDYKGSKPKLVAYRVSTDVVLKLKDFSKVAPVIQQLADADMTATQSVNYILENMEAAKGKAVEDAYRRARAAADTVARASGRTLGELSYASVDTFEAVRPMPMRVARASIAGEAVPAPTEQFTPQTVSVTAHVNAVFELK